MEEAAEMRRIHVTPRRHIIHIELSRVRSIVAIWGLRQAVCGGVVERERGHADRDVRQGQE